MEKLNIAVTWGRSLGAVAPFLSKVQQAGASGVRVIAKGFENQDNFFDLLQEFGEANSRERCLPVMLDLPVERPTIGHLPQSLDLKIGYEYTLSRSPDVGPFNLPVLGMSADAGLLEPGDILDVADGRVRFEVLEIQGEILRCVALTSHPVAAHRSIRCRKFRNYSLAAFGSNLLDYDLSGLGVTSVALSFVENASTLEVVRRRCAHWTHPPKLVAKIESVNGIFHLPTISAIADGIMVGRGDLSFLSGRRGFMNALDRLVDGVSDWNSVSVATGILGGLVEGSEATVSDVSDLSHWIRLGVRSFLLCDFPDVEGTCRALDWFADQDRFF